MVSPFVVTNPNWSFGIPIPNDAGLIGLQMITQTAYASTANPPILEMTNAVYGIFGL